MNISSRWIPMAGLCLAMMLWASSFIALKLAFQHYDPMVVIFGRMFLASLCFIFFIPGYYRKIDFRKKDLKLLFFMAFCEPCLYFIFESMALERTTASQAGMITAMLPLMVAIAARFCLKEKISSKTIVGFVLAIAGAVWLSYMSRPSSSAPNPPLGNFLEFLAMVCATGYTISMKHLTKRYPPFFLTAVQAFIGSLFYFPLLFLPATELPIRFETVPALAIVYLGVIITLGAYGLYNFGVSRIPASQASVFVNLIPVFTVFLGWLVLGEQFTNQQYLAAFLVFAGVFVSQDTRLPLKRRHIISTPSGA